MSQTGGWDIALRVNGEPMRCFGNEKCSKTNNITDIVWHMLAICTQYKEFHCLENILGTRNEYFGIAKLLNYFFSSQYDIKFENKDYLREMSPSSPPGRRKISRRQMDSQLWFCPPRSTRARAGEVG